MKAANAAEEEPDFGAEEDEEQEEVKTEPAPAAPAPGRRSLVDYSDLVEGGAGGAAQGPAAAPRSVGDGKARPDALHVSGVQRLTRTHLLEVFAFKKLPTFKTVEWIADDEAVCVWGTEAEAKKVLAACEEGFDEVSAKPGPGLWRAQRGMMEFRAATEGDVPSAEFKKKHRGGKQVREFRFWEAMKDMSKGAIDEAEDAQGIKRLLVAPSGEDAFAAADFDDDLQRRKRLRRGGGPAEEDDGGEIDLLRQMAEFDRTILAKQEVRDGDDVVKVSKANDAPLVRAELEAPAVQLKKRQTVQGRNGSWHHDDRWGNGDDWNGNWGGPAKRRRTGDGGEGGKGKGRGRGSGGPKTQEEKEKEMALLDPEEAQRRQKRAERFKASA